jgi:hypothetical protein
MSNHLSQDQFAKCAVGRPSRAELHHIGECPECSAELERFGNTLLLFRSAIRHRIGRRSALQTPVATVSRPAEAGVPRWRWALVTTAFVVLVTLPFFMSEYKPPQASTETTPDEIMDRVNRHLSRMVPAPMEPMMALIPSEEFVSKSGGVQ